MAIRNVSYSRKTTLVACDDQDNNGRNYQTRSVSRNNFNEDIEADLTNLDSRYSPKTRNENNEKMKVDEGVKACEQRIEENKVTIRQKKKKFTQLMSYDDNIGLRALEDDIKQLNRLNGINQ